MPTLQMLSAQAQVVVQDRFTEIMESAKDPEDFETSLRDAVSEALLKNYRQEALIKMRVERDIEKNMTVQTLNDIFIPDAVATEMTAKKDIDKTTEKNIRNIMGIRDKSTESMRSDELRRRR